MQLAAINSNGYAIQHIHNPSEAVQIAAVKNNGYTIIQYIHNPSEVVQLAAVKENGYAIQHIHNPSEAVQLEAVKNDGYVIQYIHNPSEAVQIAALENNPDCIKFFKKAWIKNKPKKMTVSEICAKLGCQLLLPKGRSLFLAHRRLTSRNLDLWYSYQRRRL